MPRRRFEPTRSPADLRTIAWYQRILIPCMLGQLFLWVGYIGLFVTGFGPDDGEDLLLLVMGVSGLLHLAGAVFVLLLGAKVNGPVLGIFLGLLALVPCFGLVMMVVASVQASGVLTAHGVRVGLFGANGRDLATLDEPFDDVDDEEDEGW
jgi:hypothetical protein